MGETTLFQVVLSFLLLNYSHSISAQDSGLISKSRWNNFPANANGQSKREIVNGEKLIVAEEISCWEQNGHWEKLQVCPESKIVTGHRFRYLVRTGLTGIELKCTQKFERGEPESPEILQMNSEPGEDLPRGKWGNWKNKTRSGFAEGFSFNREELSLRRSVENYNVIYHSGNQVKAQKKSKLTVDLNSAKMYTKCPADHAICGLTAMMDKAGLGILTAVGLKCCHHCFPEETWVTIHHHDNTGGWKEEQEVNTTVGLQRTPQNSADDLEIPHTLVLEEFSARFRKVGKKSSSTGFHWPDLLNSEWTKKAPATGRYTCEAKRSCVFKQLVGVCGSVHVPVAKFCDVSGPIGSSIPDSCNSKPEERSGGKMSAGPSDSFPYQLSLQFNENPPNGRWRHICGGVILDENAAITAASCFDQTRHVRRYQIVTGENVVLQGKQTILGVQRILIHPDYTNFSNGSNIAILYLKKFGVNEYFRPISLLPFSDTKLSNVSSMVNGWGQVSNQGHLSNSPLKWNASILSPADCGRWLETVKFQSTEGILCALNPVAQPCEGDAGGPLFIPNYKMGNSTRDFLVGLVSYGATDCEIENHAGFFTEINHFYNWIQENRGTKINVTNIASCSDAEELFPSTRSKEQTIYPDGPDGVSLDVLCGFETEVDGGGWTIIQKRSSGPKEEFNRNWNDYAKGFGSLDKNFWIGLENIHTLTKIGDQELRVELEDFEGEKRWAKYSKFWVSNASDFYRLSVDGYDGDAGNGMISSESWGLHNGMQFTTPDNDHDKGSTFNCAERYSGGWWFNSCGVANLNGLYFEKGETVPRWHGINWYLWKGGEISLAKTEMKIRKRK